MSYANIYVMKAGEFVKIGFSKDPEKRLKQIQTGNPVSVEMICSTPGSIHAEAEIHSCLRGAGLKMNGEWYKEKDVIGVVQSLLRGDVGQARDRARSRYVRATAPPLQKYSPADDGSPQWWACCSEVARKRGPEWFGRHLRDVHGASRSQAKAAVKKMEQAGKDQIAFICALSEHADELAALYEQYTKEGRW